MTAAAPCILAFDTATPCSSVALVRGAGEEGRIIASLNLQGSVSHSRRLLTNIDYLLEQTMVSWEEIDGIGVSLGPGSFTGLRIGMAIAKGLAMASGKPLFGVSTLDALAAGCRTSRLVCSTLDARKKEVYMALYRWQEGRCRRLGDYRVVSPQLCADTIDEPVLMVGEGALLYRRTFGDLLGDNFLLAPPQFHQASAAMLGLLAAEQCLTGDGLPETAGPIYVRRSDAELNLLAKKQAKAKERP